MKSRKIEHKKTGEELQPHTGKMKNVTARVLIHDPVLVRIDVLYGAHRGSSETLYPGNVLLRDIIPAVFPRGVYCVVEGDDLSREPDLLDQEIGYIACTDRRIWIVFNKVSENVR